MILMLMSQAAEVEVAQVQTDPLYVVNINKPLKNKQIMFGPTGNIANNSRESSAPKIIKIMAYEIITL